MAAPAGYTCVSMARVARGRRSWRPVSARTSPTSRQCSMPSLFPGKDPAARANVPPDRVWIVPRVFGRSTAGCLDIMGWSPSTESPTRLPRCRGRCGRHPAGPGTAPPARCGRARAPRLRKYSRSWNWCTEPARCRSSRAGAPRCRGPRQPALVGRSSVRVPRAARSAIAPSQGRSVAPGEPPSRCDAPRPGQPSLASVMPALQRRRPGPSAETAGARGCARTFRSYAPITISASTVSASPPTSTPSSGMPPV